MRYLYVLTLNPEKGKQVNIEQTVLNDVDKILVSPSENIRKLVSDYHFETELRLSDSTYCIVGSQKKLLQIQNVYDLLQEITCLNRLNYLLIIHEELLAFVLSYFNNDFEKISDIYRFSLGEDILSQERRNRMEKKKDYAEELLKELGFHPFDANSLLKDTSVLLSQSDILSLRKGRYLQKENIYACVSGMIKDDYIGITIDTADNAIDMIHHQTNSDPSLSVSCDLSDDVFRDAFLKNYGSL